jgi:hypothetical protein
MSKLNPATEDEPILTPDTGRFVLLPIKYHKVMYKRII